MAPPIEVPAVGRAGSSVRQAVFNDQNYVPRGADNVVALRVSDDAYVSRKLPEKVRVTVVKQTPDFKERVCAGFRQGSIEARDCRAAVGLRRWE